MVLPKYAGVSLTCSSFRLNLSMVTSSPTLWHLLSLQPAWSPSECLRHSSRRFQLSSSCLVCIRVQQYRIVFRSQWYHFRNDRSHRSPLPFFWGSRWKCESTVRRHPIIYGYHLGSLLSIQSLYSFPTLWRNNRRCSRPIGSTSDDA